MASTKDVLMIGILIFAFGIGFFILYFISSTVTTQIISNPIINQSEAAVEVFQAQSKVTGKLDYIIFGLFIGLVLGLIISGWFVGGNPIFMAIYFLIIMVSIAAGAVMSNVWETTTQASIFGSTVSAFPITNNLMMYLPTYMAVIGFLGMIVMFAKPYFAGNTGGGTY